jgi:hypothetical protein
MRGIPGSHGRLSECIDTVNERHKEPIVMVVKEKRDSRQRRKIRFIVFLGKQSATVDMVPFTDQF